MFKGSKLRLPKHRYAGLFEVLQAKLRIVQSLANTTERVFFEGAIVCWV